MNFMKLVLCEQWEMWIYEKTFFSTKECGLDGKWATPNCRNHIDELAEDVESTYHVRNCDSTRERIQDIIEMANNDRRIVNELGVAERTVLKNRGLPETEFDFFVETFKFDMYS